MRTLKIGRFRVSGLLGWLAAASITGVLLAVLGLFLVLNHYSRGLPSVDQLANYNPPVATRLYASDGRLMAEYAKQKRIFVPLSAIPKQVQRAFLSAEDRNFYAHQGVDFYGVLRAVRSNIVNYGSGRSMVGGSTITQQVVKNFLLTSEKSFERKIKEAILAYRISGIYGKEKILELYLNEIYLGRSAYGVAAASLEYFNKPLDTLSTEEMALLAAMPKAPSAYDPKRNPKAALARRNYVIGRMEDDGYIDAQEEKRALAAPMQLQDRSAEEIANAPYFAEEVRKKIAALYGSDVLYKGGLFVRTTVRPEMQKAADDALRDALRQYDRRHGFRGPLGRIDTTDQWQEQLAAFIKANPTPVFGKQAIGVVLKLSSNQAAIGLSGGKQVTVSGAELNWARRFVGQRMVGDKRQTVTGALEARHVVLVEPAGEGWRITQVPEVNGAMIVMDVHTGRVLAMSGGYGEGGPDQFNRATQAKRQPGSAFKPFVYLTALENGFTPASIVVDGPIELSQGPGLPMWRPKNYEGEYLGPTTLRRGVEKSRNTMTVRLAVMLGMKRVLRMAQRFGIYGPDESADFSMTLGAHETTLLQLANAYAMLVNGGRKVEPALIERIDDRHGTTIFRRDMRDCAPCRVAAGTAGSGTVPPTLADDRDLILDPRVAYQMTSILQGVVQRGTATAAKVLARPVGGKTGTTNDSRDVWFMGVTPDLVIGTYIGFDTPRSLGPKETGGRVALPAFIQFVQQALKDVPKTDFRIPSGIQIVPVNPSTGQPLYYGDDPSVGGAAISEAFVVGGPVMKPQSEIAAALLDQPVGTGDMFQPQDLMDAPFNPDAGGMGSMPPSESGFDPSANAPEMNRDSAAEMGTGGLY